MEQELEIELEDISSQKTNYELMTLAIVYQHPKILLGMKKRGFGKGRWNGFGGKLEENEEVEDAAHRELLEESGIQADYLEPVGVLNFEFNDNPDVIQVHIFKSESFSGDIKESEEMRPEWFNVNNIPYDEMWPDDIYWLPLFLEGKKFKGKFIFSDHDEILEYDLKEVEDI